MADRRLATARRRSPTGQPPIVSVEDATVVYPGGHVALERVSLEIDRGEFVFVVGPTGCGKSTLIKTLIRDIEPAAGSVRIAGKDINEMPARPHPIPAPPDRHRLPGLQAAAEPDRLRQRRLRAAGDRRAALADPPQGPRDPAPGRPAGEDPQLPRRALRRRAAARRDRPRVRQPPAAPARRRADRQPRSRDLDRDHAAALPDQPHRHHRAGRHPRPRDGRQDAPPRDRARGRPPDPRPGRRPLPRRVDHRVRRPGPRRDGRR